MASSDARPIPRKNVAYRVTFPIFDADGDLVSSAGGLDSEVSKDGGAFSDCTNEATEIGSSGIYYLDLTNTEMNADTVAIIIQTSTSGAKTTPIILYPEEAGDIRTDMIQLGGSTQSATDLKDFADAGYDPATNKVEGAKTVDTNTDMRGTDNAALASVCTEVRLSELDAANLPSDIDDILADTGELQTDWANGGRLDLLLDAVKAVTDLIPDAGAMNDLATLAARLTAARAGYLDELESSNIPSDIDALNTKLTSTRAGYLDNLSAGAVALEDTLTAMKGGGWSTETLKAISDAIAALENLSAAGVNAEMRDVLFTDVDTELSAVPTITSPIADKIKALFQYFIVKRTVTSSVEKMYKDDDSELGSKSVSDDGTTATFGTLS